MSTNNAGGAFSSNGAQFGLMNSLRTGHIIFDTLICLLIPILFQLISSLSKPWENMIGAIWSSFFTNKDKYVIFTIEDELLVNSWGMRRSDEGSQRNDLLQKAISLYLNELKHIEYKEASVSFTAVVDCYTTRYDDTRNTTTVDQLKKFDVRLLPPNDVWTVLQPGLEFKQCCDDGGDDKNDSEKKAPNGPKIRTIRHTFRSENPLVMEKINQFLKVSISSFHKYSLLYSCFSQY